MLNADYGALLPELIPGERRRSLANVLRTALTSGLALLPSGTSELVMHPSAMGAGVPTAREREAQLLRDAQGRETLRDAGILPAAHW